MRIEIMWSAIAIAVLVAWWFDALPRAGSLVIALVLLGQVLPQLGAQPPDHRALWHALVAIAVGALLDGFGDLVPPLSIWVG